MSEVFQSLASLSTPPFRARRYNRHAPGANYIYYDGHVEFLRWSKARIDQYPDHVVRDALPNPPQ